jgi:hypothetical protein
MELVDGIAGIHFLSSRAGEGQKGKEKKKESPNHFPRIPRKNPEILGRTFAWKALLGYPSKAFQEVLPLHIRVRTPSMEALRPFEKES